MLSTVSIAATHNPWLLCFIKAPIQNIERINLPQSSNMQSIILSSKDEFIIITARIGARKFWADMFEYSYKTEITKNKT